ncbi:isopentenyl-diphosphate Delta-isomerase 1-like isoform X2 [Homarus americanus]|uniref:isopentenyl-diphosphate Delta-isomerase n=2 Tax=Homarus americanus TaxID=6706 RepID=A0A8J5JSF4_HOMAM|nr:isopentenyl-diphosphate Delta-isomerase 1-like isoform X2 [Homarus americanus]XP_042231270.1 isopentenyl-diphosphate Delta-isomerase 1-like isoform X2 [Homarus americanus]XP_042231271.1 isopentenyl-diphosphate Delta-isomerase 1-like isoform X2 [Homarus americanus]KAG7163487.1 Isopentenyl-diphosphate Delta-isomerase 1-like [Homarus americanus]
MALYRIFEWSLLQTRTRFLHTSSSGLIKQSNFAEDIDPQQYALLDEPCILVDENDTNIGTASKRDCHLMQNGSSLLHRAFSVFLFNKTGELLVHRRSDAKITFPGHYTNTCCSHPLHTPQETIEDNVWGIRHAAQRRLEFELGIPREQAMPGDFTYLTRIHYASPSDGMWGEHEMDYILFLQRDVSVNPNENEVQDVRYVKREDFNIFLKGLRDSNIPITPWFSLIAEKFLPLWWKNLDNLHKFTDHNQIHRMLK